MDIRIPFERLDREPGVPSHLLQTDGEGDVVVTLRTSPIGWAKFSIRGVEVQTRDKDGGNFGFTVSAIRRARDEANRNPIPLLDMGGSHLVVPPGVYAELEVADTCEIDLTIKGSGPRTVHAALVVELLD